MHITGPLREAIDRCFEPDTVEGILKALEAEASSHNDQTRSRNGGSGIQYQPDWAHKTLKAIRGRSPTSLKVTLRQLQYGKEWSIREAFAREHQIASHFMEHPDFVEGVSARLMRKPPTTPQWQPNALNEVSEKAAENFFLQPAGDRMSFFNTTPAADYSQYPHLWIGLPQEAEVRASVREKNRDNKAQSKADVVQDFVLKQTGKPGVVEVVQEILDRQTVEAQNKLWWRDDWERELETREDKEEARRRQQQQQQ